MKILLPRNKKEVGLCDINDAVINPKIKTATTNSHFIQA